MSSHVPFLAVRPDDQFSTEVKKTVRNVTKPAPPPSQPVDAPPPLTPAPPTNAAARIPSAIRFPLLVILSFSLSTFIHSVTADFSGLPISTASRSLKEPWQIATLLGWKVVELFIAWIAGYDYEDIAALTLLTNQPTYYLLHTYWALPLLPLALSLTTDILVVALPFALLRPLTRAQLPLTPKTPNQSLATDSQILLLTAALAASIYAVTFSLVYHANLGVFLISHFQNMASMAARDSTLLQLLQLFAVPGFAAMFFLFRPTIAAAGAPALREPKSRVSAGAAAASSHRRAKKFNPETATLGETLAFNLGYGESGWSRRAEVLARRTLVLAGATFVNTAVRVYATVEGTDVGGSVGYAGVWAVATVGVGVGFGLLSDEE